jgi:hypothetical protein
MFKSLRMEGYCLTGWFTCIFGRFNCYFTAVACNCKFTFCLTYTFTHAIMSEIGRLFKNYYSQGVYQKTSLSSLIFSTGGRYV